MTEQGEVRDWQKDNDRLQEIKSIFDAPGYIFYGELNEDGFVSENVADASGDFEWLIKQVEAEKERADKLQAELSEYTEAHWKAFEREKKLREAIEEEIKKGIIWGDYNRAEALEQLLASIYPLEKEGETK